MINESFANISATTAPIFVKFETYVHKLVKNYKTNFCKDLYTHTGTPCLCPVCARVFTDLYQISFVSSFLSYELKFWISKRSELTFWRYLQNNIDYILGISLVYLRYVYISSIARVHIRYISVISQVYHMYISGVFQEYLRKITGIS